MIIERSYINPEKMTKYLISLLAGIVLMANSMFAGNYAYVYIEGDKQTPFYVKMEGQMLPRLGKNYCLIPNLAAGVTNIEILFQQNAYPPQKFAINIPEGGSRGFVLQKVNDRQFALYDLLQGHYIVAGNKPEEDRLPEAGPAKPAIAAATPPASGGEEDIPAFPTEKKKKKSKTAESRPKSESNTPDSRFISDMELNTGGVQEEPLPDFSAKPAPAKSRKKKAVSRKEAEGNLAAINDEGEVVSKAKPVEPEPAPIPNTDCKTPMSSEEFENFALKILDQSDDAARIKVLSRNKGRQCFTTEQVRIIANNLDTQSGRYDVVKMLYAQTSDQVNYPKLESLFKTNYLKNKFREILNPKP